MLALLFAQQAALPPPTDAGTLGWIIGILATMLCAVSCAYAIDRRSEVKHLRDQSAESDKLVEALQKENKALIEQASDAAHRERAAKDELARTLLECAERHEERRGDDRRSVRSVRGQRRSGGDIP